MAAGRTESANAGPLDDCVEEARCNPDDSYGGPGSLKSTGEDNTERDTTAIAEAAVPVGVDIEAVRGLLELHEDGFNVTWPAGVDETSARSLVLMGSSGRSTYDSGRVGSTNSTSCSGTA